MNKEKYIKQAEDIVEGYKHMQKNPTTKLEAETKRLMKKTLNEEN